MNGLCQLKQENGKQAKSKGMQGGNQMEAMTGWFTAGRKAAISGILILGGIVLSVFGPNKGGAGMFEYYLYMMGVIGFVNILFSKISKRNMNFIFHVISSAAIASVIINMYSSTADEWTGEQMTVISLIALALLWLIHVYLIPKTPITKRLVISFFGALTSVLSMVIVFFSIAYIWFVKIGG